MSPKGQGKGNKGGGKNGKATGGGDRQKNWACEECGYTNNCAWWTVCGRDTCMGGKPEPKAPAEDTSWGKWDSWSNWSPSGWVDYSTPKPQPPDQMLRAARDNLKAVAAIFPAGHAAIAEVAKKVSELEDAQKVAVPTSEKLRCLLYTQKELESKQTNADKSVADAAQTVKTATAALRATITVREEVARELAANQLDVAALTRDVAPPESSLTGDIVQSLRARVDILVDNDFADGGFARAELGTFFQGFAKLTALIDHAELGASTTAPPPAQAPPPTPPPTAVDPVAAAAQEEMEEAKATNEGLDSSDDDGSVDADGDNTMDGEKSALAALEDANELLATSANWLTTTPAAAGSSG